MADIDIDHALSELTLNEKVDLLSGVDGWHTKVIPRLGIPAIRMSDGPNGVRGTRFFNGVPSACLPCGTALGATFDPDLLRDLGRLLGRECHAKGAHVLLGPTINIQRGPLGGRGFESFSEDPVLSGLLAASYCRGVQDEKIIPTPKHLVCNDQEHERVAVSAVVTERALREVYMLPFQLAVSEANPGALMTSYNKVNGCHASESADLLQGIVRKEWGYDGLIVSDWFGTYSGTEAINAGLDLEMPGPTRFRGPGLVHAVTSNKVSHSTLDARVRKVLEMINRTRASEIPEDAPEFIRDKPEDRALLRRAASESIVLLKNDEQILPFDSTKRTLVIGPNANIATYCGGGSAALAAYYAVTPLEGVRGKCTGDVIFTQGAYGHKELPLLGSQMKTEDGKTGYIFKVFTEPATNTSRKPVDVLHMTSSSAFLMDYMHPQVAGDLYYVTMEGIFEPDASGLYDFGLTVAGTGELFIDGQLVVDNKTNQRQGTSFFGIGTPEERGSKYLEAGRSYRILVEYGTAPTSNLKLHGVVSFGPGGLRVGGCRRIDREQAIQDAVDLAASVDQVVVCVGLSGEWESEGFDRPHMDLPPGSDELVERVLAAQPNAAVVVQSGTPVTMPWVHKTKALLHAWYGGNETGNGIADVLFGDVSPSGKLPLSFPEELRHNPSFLSFRSENGRVLYSEDVYVGYRYYDKTGQRPLFPFGYGLSYTAFSLSQLVVSNLSSEDIKHEAVEIVVSVSNTGLRAGAEALQIYISPPSSPRVSRPVRELKGAKKVFVAPGETKREAFRIPTTLATSYWDESESCWRSEQGVYGVTVVGTGVDNSLSTTFTLEKTRSWIGAPAEKRLDGGPSLPPPPHRTSLSYPTFRGPT
ncbi:beta-glucosidase H [Aspergillus lucknowensis]|uniref:beta-glucosidase n=1 Tax=Aspergillus lucknowensis TaxID=176173 RepID=A0ABR4LL90_9EURO